MDDIPFIDPPTSHESVEADRLMVRAASSMHSMDDMFMDPNDLESSIAIITSSTSPEAEEVAAAATDPSPNDFANDVGGGADRLPSRAWGSAISSRGVVAATEDCDLSLVIL